MKTRKAVYAASFDPITNGHINVVERVAPLYDELVVVVSVDTRKTYMFTPEERVSMVKTAFAHLLNVTVDTCVGRYVVKHAESMGAQVVVRGLRNFKDMEYEQVLAEENRKICPSLETVWVPCLPNLMYVSSSMVKGHIGIDPDWEDQVARSVSLFVVKKLKEKYVLGKAKKHWVALMAEFGNPKESEAVFKGLLSSYSESFRFYHTLGHVVDMLDELEPLVGNLKDKRAVKMAVWYHDVVCEPRTKNHPVKAENEKMSTYRARLDMEKLGLPISFIEEVCTLIMATTHTDPVYDPDAEFLVDLDLAVFGKPEKEFDRYENGVRNEYAGMSEVDFRNGRTKVLSSFLDRGVLYYTKVFRDRYEDTARKNLKRSVEKLRK